jgi:hypothetical protein
MFANNPVGARLASMSRSRSSGFSKCEESHVWNSRQHARRDEAKAFGSFDWDGRNAAYKLWYISFPFRQ